MDKYILQRESPEERERILSNSCDQIEERYYTRKYTQEEINDTRADLADISLRIADKEEEKRAINEQLKADMKPLVERRTTILGQLKAGGERVKGNVYKMTDPDKNEVGYYNSEGMLIEERPMREDEKQRSVFQIMRNTGTDN